MEKRVFEKKIFRNLTIFLCFIIMSIFIISVIHAEDNPDLKKKVEDALKDIQTKGENYKYSDFKSLDSAVQTKIVQEHLKDLVPTLKKSDAASDRKDFFSKHSDDLVKGFNSEQFGSEKRSELFYDKDDKKQLLLDDDIRNKLWKSVNSDKMRGQLFLDVVNRAYKSGKYEGTPELKSVDLKNSDKLNWKGLKVIGEKGGSQNLDTENIDPSKPSDSPHPGMKSFSYDNGKIKEAFSTGREIGFQEGSLQWKKEVIDKETGATGRLIYYAGKDGNIVGEKKGLSLGFGAVDSSKGEKSSIDVSYSPKGDIDFKLSGKADETYLAANDQFGYRYKIGMSDRVDKEGISKEGTVEVRRLNGEDFLAISGNAKAMTNGLGEIKARGNTPVVLGGTYFDNPGAGAMKINDKIEAQKTKAVLGVAGEATKTAATNLLSYFTGDKTKSISETTTESTEKQTKEAFDRLISRTPAAMRSGESYADVNFFIDEYTQAAMDAKKQGQSVPYMEYSMGGKSVEMDVTNAYMKVNRVYASSTG
ncbi:Uncharacterised protein [uncultured archaeon]|nr:Uncharacterised protein [uncultured archaeon]